jgi:hypothetical protein
MAARFIRDPEIVTGLAPLDAVRRHAAAAGAELGQQVRELMPQSAIDLSSIMFAQARVERDDLPARIGPPGRAEKPRVPFDADLAGELLGIQGRQDFAGFCFKRRIASQNDRRKSGWENEIELLCARFVVQPQGAAV